MNYHHKSGAQKRREKNEREKKTAHGSRTLDVFGFSSNRQANNTNSIADENNPTLEKSIISEPSSSYCEYNDDNIINDDIGCESESSTLRKGKTIPENPSTPCCVVEEIDKVVVKSLKDDIILN